MSEKGDKGYSAPYDVKSSLKSAVSLQGKDDNSTKLRKGRTVQFNYEDSLDAKTNGSTKSGGKFDTLFAKGDSGKGGKGDRTENGAKTPVAKEAPPLELKIEREILENSSCIMDCEAAQILNGVQEQMVILSKDPSIKIPVSFDHALQYAKRGNPYSNPHAVKGVLETLKKHGVSDGEICMIANARPESVEETFTLIPSFKGKKRKLREDLKSAISELVKLKNAA